jgi:plasmid maintenance system antidote protein VapI
MSLTESIREAIARAELSLYDIEHETDVLYPALRNLMAGKGGVRLSTADKLATYFGLRLIGPDDETPAADEISLSERLRSVILRSGQSLQAIQLESGVRTDALVRFLAGEQDLLLATADKLAKHFGLTLSESPERVLTPVGAI